jgi:hypothetical protein
MDALVWAFAPILPRMNAPLVQGSHVARGDIDGIVPLGAGLDY